LETFKLPLSFCNDLLLFITNSLKDKYYVIASVDVFYIPCHKKGYNRFHFVHPILIYGINSANEYLVADHFLSDNGKYSINKVSYGDFYNGLLSAHGDYLYQNYLPQLYLTRYRHNKNNYHVNIFALKINLERYLNSSLVMYYHENVDSFNEDIKFGYKCLIEFADYIEHAKILSDEHVRLLHELYTHFSITNLIVKKLGCNSLVEQADDIVKRSLILRTSLLKNLLQKSEIRFDCSLLKKLIDIDFNILSKIYQIVNREI
jgi:hypothetical protein